MESIKLTNEKVLKMSNELGVLGSLEFNEKMYSDEKTSRGYWQKFVYAISRNSDMFDSVAKAIKKVLDPSKEYKEYNVKRSEVAQKWANIDASGKPVTDGMTYVITKNRKEFDEEMKVLQDKYKVAIESYEKLNDSIVEILEKEEEVQYYKIKSEWVPMTLTSNQLKALLSLIEGEI
jgi:hypothetical protein